MTNQEIIIRLSEAIKRERCSTQEVLELIREADQRKLYLELGFPNLYEWLVEGYGYSRAAAHRRITSARLLGVVPEIKEKLDEGKLNLTTLTQLGSAIRSEERRTDQRLSVEAKKDLVARICEKSSEETQKIIACEFPETKARESLRPTGENANKLTLSLDDETIECLKRVKELLSHSQPDADFASIIKHLAKEFVKRNDPLEKKPAAGFSKKSITPAVRRYVIQRARGACEYKDPETGRVCGCRVRVEVDHIWPRALGGSDDPWNLRLLCREHNLLAAERIFGKKAMARYRGSRDEVQVPAP